MTSTAFDDEHHGTIEIRVDDHRARLVLRGEIDGARRDEASRALAAVVTAAVPVEIETAEVTFIDSSGIAFLVQVQAIGADEGFPVTLVEPSEIVIDVLRMIGLDDRFGLAPSATGANDLIRLVS